jgi:hypothetical protein
MRTALFAMTLLFSTAAFADVRIFFYPTVEHGPDAVRVSAIAFVEGSGDAAERVRNTVLDRRLYQDSLIDRRELAEALAGVVSEPVLIFGSACRIIPVEEDRKPPREVIVFKGERVGVVVKRKGVTVEFSGVAQSDGAEGDRMAVALGKKGVIKGRLAADKSVEVGF